jgi:hypothetical protein
MSLLDPRLENPRRRCRDRFAPERPAVLTVLAHWLGRAPSEALNLAFKRRPAVALIPVLALLVTACAHPVTVKRVDNVKVSRELTANILSTGAPSAYSRQLLSRRNLTARFDDDPRATLAVLHEQVTQDGSGDLLFALSELSFAHARASGERPYFLASAVYAYAYLLPADAQDTPHALDPRLRLAGDLYNRGLTEGLMSNDGREVILAAGKHALPFGTLDVELDPDELVWAGRRLEQFTPVADLEVRGFRNRYRRRGLGVPLAAKPARPPTRADGAEGARWINPTVRAAVTALVLIDDVHEGLRSGSLHGRLELYDAMLDDTALIEGREVPLELELSASLAYGVADSPLWDFELAGFRRGDFRQAEIENDLALRMIAPHEFGRIPVVFVHGTASSPLRWAEMVNELMNDPSLRGRFEYWFFLYNTGNPILVSGAKLRRALTMAVRDLDPEGRDPTLHEMVVIGHSQGGLLTKMMVVDSGDRLWEQMSSVSLDQLDLQPQTREVLEQAFFFDALPFVRRVVFIATPHGGSFLAERKIAGLVKRLVTLPGRVARAGNDLIDALRKDPKAQARRRMRGVPTSVDSMTPGDPFLETLRDLPIVDGVAVNTIAGVRGDGPVEKGNDGVVAYQSAHLDGADSEFVVRSGHSMQSHPDTIAEVRRVLLLHLYEDRGAAGLTQ